MTTATANPKQTRRTPKSTTPDTATPVSAQEPPPRLRRRPALMAAGVALVALGGLTAAWLAASASDTEQVLAVRAPVERGAVIEASDLVPAAINPDPNLATIPLTAQAQVVGQRAAVELAAGALVTPESVTTAMVPAAGQSLVGVTVTTAQMPAEPLQAGDRIRIVDTPRPQDDPPRTAPASLAAVVVATSFQDDTGNTVVDVTVPDTESAKLAARASTGRIAIVKDSVAK